MTNHQFICTCSGGALSRVTILAEWLRYFNDLAVGETAAPACFSRENAPPEHVRLSKEESWKNIISFPFGMFFWAYGWC
jgi:hypothetical protein